VCELLCNSGCYFVTIFARLVDWVKILQVVGRGFFTSGGLEVFHVKIRVFFIFADIYFLPSQEQSVRTGLLTVWKFGNLWKDTIHPPLVSCTPETQQVSLNLCEDTMRICIKVLIPVVRLLLLFWLMLRPILSIVLPPGHCFPPAQTLISWMKFAAFLRTLDKVPTFYSTKACFNLYDCYPLRKVV